MWLTLALTSALLLAVRRIFEKKLTGVFGNFSLSLVTLGFSLPFLATLYFFSTSSVQITSLSARFWMPLIFIWIFLYPLQNYFLYRSLREGEFSEVTPVSALLPAFNIVSSFIVIHELPTMWGALGIALTVLATWLLLSNAGSVRINMPVLFMTISVLCTAVGSTLDKVAIEVSDPVTYSFVNISGAILVFGILTFATRSQGELRYVRAHIGTLCFMGALLAVGFVVFSSAFTLGPTSYTLALRSGGLLLAALWGIVFLHESLSRKKLTALALFTFGTLFLAVG